MYAAGSWLVPATAVMLVPIASAGGAQMGTAFTYQGELSLTAGGVVDDACDFAFSLYDVEVGGAPVAGPVSREEVQVTAGRFTIDDLDFGPDVFTGEARWLEIAVCCPSVDCVLPGDLETLDPRQELTPAPHALALSGLQTRQNEFSTNLIGGYSGNVVAEGVSGAVIAGGGNLDAPNQVLGDYAGVGGGEGNTAGGPDEPRGCCDHGAGSRGGSHSKVCGGKDNTASGNYSYVGGGQDNWVPGEGHWGAITGGYDNYARYYAAVCGGYDNDAMGDYSGVLGGRANSTSTDGAYGHIGGGYNNNLSGYASSIVGGYQNTLEKWGDYDPDYSVIVGGKSNVMTRDVSYAMAFGQAVKVMDRQYAVHFFEDHYDGSVAINRDTDDGVLGYPLYVGKGSNNGNGAYLSKGGHWHDITKRADARVDRARDGRELLSRIASVPVGAWEYQDTGERHFTPFTEDFHAAFDVGALKDDGTRDTEGLAAADIAGVALGGVKALDEIMRDMDAQIAALEARVVALERAAGAPNPERNAASAGFGGVVTGVTLALAGLIGLAMHACSRRGGIR